MPTTPTEDYLGEFKGRYNSAQNVDSLIQKLNGDATESSAAREALVAQMPFQNPAQGTQVLVSHPHEFAPYATAVKVQAYGKLEDYFDAKGKEVIAALPAGKLEKLALTLLPVKIPGTVAEAGKHNGAIPLWEKHAQIAQLNDDYDEDPRKAEARGYNEGIATQIKDDPTLVIKADDKAGPKEKKAWEHYQSASLKMALSNSKFARITGEAIQGARAKKFMDYLAADPAYSASEFVRNTIAYSDGKRAMPIIGQILNEN